MPIKSLYIVTGSSSGIGLSLCKNLIQNPDNLVLGMARRGYLASENFQYYPLDLSKIETIQKFEFPKIDDLERIVLINNAGTLGEINTLDKIKLEALTDIISVNYTSPMLLSTKFIQQYQSTQAKKLIINISSGAATSPYASWANYCASKAALEMFTKCINEEQKEMKYPIISYSIAPGVVDTSMQEYIRNTDKENFKNKSKFIELYNNQQLYNADKVADKIIEIVNRGEVLEERVFRIQL